MIESRINGRIKNTEHEVEQVNARIREIMEENEYDRE